MAWFLPLLYLSCHGLLLLVFPGQARTLSILCVTGASLVAGLACLRQGHRQASVNWGWFAIAGGMLFWVLGMAVNLPVPSLSSSGPTINPGLSMLFFVLYGVPLTFALAYPGNEPWRVRLMDGALCLVLGCMFTVHTFDYASLLGTPQENVPALLALFDAENAFILVFSLLRWLSSPDIRQGRLFGALSAYAAVYLAVAFYINHLRPVEEDYGGLTDLAIDVPFMVLAVCAWRKEAGVAFVATGWPVRVMKAASPLVMPMALLVVSGFLLRTRLMLAVTGFVAATLGYGMRNVLVQLGAFERMERLDELARKDPLTGLANRRQLDEVLHSEWERARRAGTRIGLLMVDVDHFKAFNDTWGHQAGDRCLQEVARILAGCVSRTSGFIARYGGEEFVVVVASDESRDITRLAESMRAAVAERLASADTACWHATVSIGAAVMAPVTAGDAARLIDLADAALYQAKAQGRNRVVLCETVIAGGALRAD